VIDTSLRRLRMERLDLVQFHWWNYEVPRWLETAHWLGELRRAGKIDKIGGTNFDTRHMVEMIESGVPLASMQVQYSVLDRRPRKSMVAAALKHGVGLFCYGTVAGGFLSEKWLGAPEPKDAMENRSLTKYRLVIEEFGGWELFQALLRTLDIAQRPNDIATVARYVGVVERGGGHRRRPQPLAFAGQPGDLGSCADRGGSRADRSGAC
jgi:aryl-alcohol dehydrogenase-like predicted oxidoreductase